MSPSPKLAELIADVRELLRYMGELGVDGLAVELPEINAVEVPARAETGASREIADLRPAAGRASVVSDQPKAPPPAMPVLARKEAEKPRPAGSRLNALPSLPKRERTPLAGGLRPMIEQGNDMPKTKAVPAEGESLFGEIGPAFPETQESIADIRQDVGNCTRCPLHQGRTKIVHTAGNFEADLMFVGEAPGADEDEQGLPFVGRAGQLLTKIIEAIGLSRDQVVIGNINRCRPPGNRQPTLPEAHTCRPFLMREIAVIKPKVIVVLGNTAMHNLLDTKVGITKMRGQFHDYFGVKVMPTFHPAYLLRDPSKKREVWEDMKKVKTYLSEAQ
jgi:DNA polymerase